MGIEVRLFFLDQLFKKGNKDKEEDPGEDSRPPKDIESFAKGWVGDEGMHNL